MGKSNWKTKSWSHWTHKSWKQQHWGGQHWGSKRCGSQHWGEQNWTAPPAPEKEPTQSWKHSSSSSAAQPEQFAPHADSKARKADGRKSSAARPAIRAAHAGRTRMQPRPAVQRGSGTAEQPALESSSSVPWTPSHTTSWIHQRTQKSRPR